MVKKNIFYFMPRTFHNLKYSANKWWDLELKKIEVLIHMDDVLSVNNLVGMSMQERLIYKPMSPKEEKYIDLDHEQKRIRSDYCADLTNLFYDDVLPVISSFLHEELSFHFEEAVISEKVRNLNKSYSYHNDIDRGDIVDLSTIAYDTDVDVYLSDHVNEKVNSFHFSGEHFPYFSLQSIFKEYRNKSGSLDEFVKNFPVMQVQLNKKNDGWIDLSERFFENVNNSFLIHNYVSEDELAGFYRSVLKTSLKHLT